MVYQPRNSMSLKTCLTMREGKDINNYKITILKVKVFMMDRDSKNLSKVAMDSLYTEHLINQLILPE